MPTKTTDFDKKQKKFFERYDIKINSKTGKWNKEFYIENDEFKLGRIPPLSIIVGGKIISLCKFCQSPLTEPEYKGHDKYFCNSRCQQEYFQIRKKFDKLHDKDQNVSMIIRYPKKEKPKEELSKTKPLERNQMDVLYKDLSKKPLTSKKSTRKKL